MLIFAIPFLANAQTKTVTGKVTSEKDGSAVSGASVVAKGSNKGTKTSADGTYSLSVPTATTAVVISSVNFATMVVTIDASNNANAALAAGEASGLSEVVVIGYGSAKRKDVTGSISTVKAKDFNAGLNSAPDQLIQGKVAGVQMTNNSGAPGGATTLTIRGVSSIRGGNSPLIVVDGVPLSTGTASPNSGSELGGDAPSNNPLAFINPGDIATMDVLKDASATAIYGSRGANGVVIITTKKGTGGQPKLEFSTSVGSSKMIRPYDVLSGDEYRAALTKYGLSTAVSTLTTATGNGGTSVDALKAIMRTAITTNNFVAINGGTENGRYRLSLGSLNQEGIVKESGFKKITASLTTSFKFLESKKLGLDFNIITTNTNTENAPIGSKSGYQGSVIGAALGWNPTMALTNADGSPIRKQLLSSDATKLVNPLALIEGYDDKSSSNTILASIAPSYKITDDLEYKMLFSVNHSTGNREIAIRNWVNIDNLDGVGYASIINNKNVTTSLTHTLNYNKAVSSNVNLNALAGYEYFKFDNSGTGMNGKGFVDYPDLKYTDYIQNLPTANRNVYAYKDAIGTIQSFFGRVNVGYSNRFNLSATFRADGSSRFGKNNKYGYFPSAALSWNVSNESFLKDVKGLDYLKLRVGWGKTGNQEFADNAVSLKRIAIGIGSNQTLVNQANDDLKWESSSTTNVGIDFGLLKNKITGTLDYFNKSTKDIIYNLPITQPGPASSFWTNLPAIINNSGVELTLQTNVYSKKDWNINFGVNMSFIKNKLTGLSYEPETGEINGAGLSNVYSQRLKNDYGLNTFYVANWEGLDAAGFSKYTGGGSTVKSYQGSPLPKTLLGFTTDVAYKNWSLVANFNGAFGHYIYNNTRLSVPIGNLGVRNVASYYLASAAKEDRANASAASTRDLEKGNYLKLANTSLSYRLGNVAKAFKGVVVSLTGQNLLVLTKYTGFDPEVNVDKNVGGIPSRGIEYNQFPSSKSFILGLSFSL